MTFSLDSIKRDFSASISVFLVAIPLCLGIALASGAPLLSGIIAGMVGGIVVGLISKSSTSVSGPAAGLTAVVLSGINELTFEVFLTAVVLAGVFQIIMGFLKLGTIANYFPSSVIKGLLAAIGIILILKQIPHAIGFDKDPEGDFSYQQIDGENTFTEMYQAFFNIVPGAFIVTVISMFILLSWNKTKLKNIQFLPPSLVVVVLGIIINELFGTFIPEFYIQSSHLVNIPSINIFDLQNLIHFPKIDDLSLSNVWIVAFTLAAIASLETLLNIESVDKIDPHKRYSPPNRELLAQGVGNIFSGFLGGIPVTSVIVRSSVNVHSNNSTKLSAVLHGIFILISVLLLTQFLNKIPLAALASILLTIGYKLASIDLFKATYKKGLDQFLPFVITIILIVFTDLLIGVLLGLLVCVFFVIRSNFFNSFKHENNIHYDKISKIEFASQVSFLNKAKLKKALWNLPENSKIIIDATFTNYIDNDIIEILEDFKGVFAKEHKIAVNIIGLDINFNNGLNVIDENIGSLTYESDKALSVNDVLQILKNGNERFMQKKSIHSYSLHQIPILKKKFKPFAVIIGCIDTGFSHEVIFDTNIGEITSFHVAGNIVGKAIIESLEMLVETTGLKLIVIKAHTNCKVISHFINNTSTYTNTKYIKKRIEKAIEQCNIEKTDSLNNEIINKITIQNTHNIISEIMNESEFLSKKIASKELGIVSALLETDNGKVTFETVN